MFFRAIMESICLGEAFSAKRIVVAGGASNSRFWLQIHADTIGAPLELTEVPDAPAPRLRDIGSMRGRAICNY